MRKDAERNRLRILAGARTVFARLGLDAPIDAVAQEAGVGIGTVYRHFPNREALLEALVKDARQTLEWVLAEADAMPRGWDGLRWFISSVMELQAQDKGLRDVIALHRVPDAEQNRLRELIWPSLHRLVARAQDQGDLRPGLTSTDVGVLAVAAIGAVEFTAPVGGDVWHRYLSIVMDGMRALPDSVTEPLEQAPLDDDEFESCLVGWKFGSHVSRRAP